ncbi:MAG TPA: hypothetical protein VFL83_07745 [Anaeromyxobacter sp.]|nr:hypothetical protein [Anaeromyxobacter sp.]
MRGFVANTDFDWFTFLSARQPLEEVNFALQGRVIHLPDRAGDHPDPVLLRWHNEQVFERGAA